MRLLSCQRSDVVERLLLIVGVGLLPVYVFGSGGIQPSHMVLTVFFIVVLFKQGIVLASWIWLLIGLSFYALVVEIFYVGMGSDPSSLIHGVFFLYNFFLVSAIYSYCYRYGLSALSLGLIIAAFIAIFSVSLGGVSLQDSSAGRAAGSFNNPNQLGYFSVCLLSLTYLIYRCNYFRYPTAVGLFCVSAFLSVVSLSKAAMVANFIVIFLALKPVRDDKPKTIFALIGLPLFWVIIIATAIGAVIVSYMQGTLDEYIFIKRLQGMAQEQDSSLEARGYFAFLEGHPIQIVFGLGTEGVAEIVGHEVHSTLASVLNNYGLIGFGFFFGAMVVWFYKLWRAYGVLGAFCLMGAPMLYGITHNGTRFAVFWILFGASLAAANIKINEARSLVAKTNSL